VNEIRKHLTYANVVSSICLFLLLGGGAALAAGQLGKNTVGSTQLKKNAVTAAKLKNNSVAGAKIQANAISSDKIADSAVTPTKIADNAVTSTKIADNAVTLAKIAENSVNSTKVVDKSLTGKDVASDSLTGENIAESTLGQVPDAAKLAGKTAAQFTSSDIYKNESPVEAGQTLGDGTQTISEACNPGDILLSGGPANIASTTTLLESFPSPGSTNSWTARVNKNAQTDNYSVVILCARQG
jgi:hypothetical protein